MIMSSNTKHITENEKQKLQYSFKNKTMYTINQHINNNQFADKIWKAGTKTYQWRLLKTCTYAWVYN